MSSIEFWEEDPQLYWAYRTFYLKKEEMEAEKYRYSCWLEGNINYIATSSSLRDGFSKGKPKGFPKFEELFKNGKINIDNSINKDVIQQQEFNSWARM